MATVNLGRIKPTWQGAWDNSTAYVADDMVQYNNHAWIAVTTNTNSAPADGNSDWDLMALGSDLPTQSGQAGKVLKTDGSSLSWGEGGTLRQFARSVTHGSNGSISGTGSFSEIHTNFRCTITPTSADSVMVIQLQIGISVSGSSRAGIKIFFSSDSGSTFGQIHQSGESHDEMYRNDNGSALWLPKTHTYIHVPNTTNQLIYSPYWNAGVGSAGLGDNTGEQVMCVWELAP